MKRVMLGIAVAVIACAVALALQEAIEQAREQGRLDDLAASSVACDHADDAFCTHLPVVELFTKGQDVLKDATIVGSVAVIDHAEGANHVADEPTFSSDATIKYRGASSYSDFDKMSYRIELVRDGAARKKANEEFLGMAADSDWVLYGPFLDRSFLRNWFMYGVARETLEWAPDTRFCELFVDGEYQGIYLAVEPVRNSEMRLRLTQFGLISGQTAYVLRRDREGSDLEAIDSYGNEMGHTHGQLFIVYPSYEDITERQREWIESDLDQFERALYADDFASPTLGYAAYIDVPSFVDYYLLNEFAMITDASYLSTFAYKNLNGTLRMTVWDFNNGFDNYQGFERSTEAFIVADNNWFDRLLQDRSFLDATIARWAELRAGVLSDSSIVSRLDAGYASLGDAIQRNNEVWGYTFNEKLLADDADGNPRDPSSSEEALAQLKETALARAAWLDEHLPDLYASCVN